MTNGIQTADGSGGGGGEEGGGPARRHRLPRWTRREIMVLIEGKRAVEGLRRGVRGPRVAAATETKWAAVSAYCWRGGVDRGPVQCRKRWGNLACDFKKIRAWERGKGAASGESFWAMRHDRRRDLRLPGLFDNEVYHILDSASGEDAEEEVEVMGGDGGETAEENEKEEEEEEAAAVFDSGWNEAENGLFFDFEHENGVEELPPPIAVTPISARKFDPFQQEFAVPGIISDKQPANDPEKQSLPQGKKRRRISPDRVGNNNFHNQLIKVLERNNKMIMTQLKAQNANFQLDRDQRKEQANGLLDVLNKLADALGRIADKLQTTDTKMHGGHKKSVYS